MYYFGIGIMVSGLLLIAGLLFARRELGMGAIIGIGIVGSFIGVLIIELPSIQQVVISWGEGKSLAVNIQDIASNVITKAAEVRSDADDVKALKDQVAVLAQQVKTSQQDVAKMTADVRQAYRGLFEALIFNIAIRGQTHPPTAIENEMEKRLEAIAAFAYKSPQEANEVRTQIFEIIENAEKPSPIPAPTVAPTPKP